MPPRAAAGSFAVRAQRAQRTGPSAAASGWLAVANAGERKANPAPASRARRRSAGPWAELVTRRRRRKTEGQRPARRWTPAPSAAASRTSPATTRARRRVRQMRMRSRPRAARSGSPSWRSTTPARPRGRRATACRGSGSRRASVNSQRTGRLRPARCRAAAALAQAISRVSFEYWVSWVMLAEVGFNPAPGPVGTMPVNSADL